MADFLTTVEQDLAQFKAEADAFMQRMVVGLNTLFGAGHPFAQGMTVVLHDISQAISDTRIVVHDVEQTVIATEPMVHQVVQFVSNVMKGIKGGPLASNWQAAVLKVLELGVPIALEVLSGGTTTVTLSAELVSKLMALL